MVKQFSTKNAEKQDWKEVEIDFAQNLKEGEMKELKVGSQENEKVLVAKYQGKLYSTGNFCTHLGAPLSTGLLLEDVVLCPWHAAAFSLTTGAHQNAPALSGVPKFEVIEKQGKFYTKIPLPLPTLQLPKMAKRDPNNKQTFVIIGGGPASLVAAQTLRQSNFTGQILVLSADSMTSYDRTLLSKALVQGEAKSFLLRQPEFFQDYDISFKTGVFVTKVDSQNKKVILKDGSAINFDKLLVATGGTARIPPIPGTNLDGVFAIREHKD